MKKALLCLLLAALCALLILRERRAGLALETSAGRYPQLVKILQEAGQDKALAAAAIGFCLLDAEGQVVFEHQARTAFIPASSLKTLTTATALEAWGPDTTLETKLRATAAIQDGVIQGDLVIEGGADPMMALADLEAWVATLKGQGLVKVTGKIIADSRAFTGSLYDDFWNWGDIGNGYGSGVAGLNLEHNRYTASFRPGQEAGMPATFLGASPEVPAVQWINEVITGAPGSGDGVVIHGGEKTGTLLLRGTVPAGGGNFTVTGAVPNPGLYAAHHLRAALIKGGIEVGGEAAAPASEEIPEASVVLLTHASPPLLEIITSIHATSDNHETECLYRLLGAKENIAPDAFLRQHWQARGLAFEGLRMEDGCGLARADFIRPLDLARLQHLAGSGPQGQLYKESLLASQDGSLRWKGGAMSGVRSSTGFARSASGAEHTFALMVNHFSDSRAVATLRERLMQALLELEAQP